MAMPAIKSLLCAHSCGWSNAPPLARYFLVMKLIAIDTPCIYSLILPATCGGLDTPVGLNMRDPW